ncbi:hypothetical protein KC345_g8861 [Hortaea werneckii]|nr:hypothetical protein KC345_g8861 [Hortaea werneckii]
MIRTRLMSLGFIGATLAGTLAPRAPEAWSDYVKNGVFYPSKEADSWRTLYARTLQLPDLSVLLSWEDYSPDVELTSWPIYRSTDGGATYSPLSRVEDTAHGVGNWYQPNLYALPEAFGDFPAGTILITGATTPRDLSEAWITVYASRDQGLTWEFVSDIVYGPGPETIRNGDKAVWEPFFLTYQGKLVCYYSTQVDPDHAQKLVIKTTSDLRTWSEEVEVVAEPEYGARPGMAVVAYSEHSRKYVMTYEYCGAPEGGCRTYFKTAFSPLEFQAVEGLPLNPGNVPEGGPYVIWTRDYNGNGVFLASATNTEVVWTNTDDVDPNGWMPVDVNQWAAYSRCYEIIQTPSESAADGKRKLLISNGGNIGCAGDCYNYVADALVDIPYTPRLSQGDFCAPEGLAGSAPTTNNPDTADAFLKNDVYNTSATSADTPDGYVTAFKNLNGATEMPSYMGYVRLDSYNTTACAAQCNSASGCNAFNIFYQRTPTLNPAPGCPDPASGTVVTCSLYSSSIDAGSVTNKGQWREKFHVVIAASNGYNRVQGLKF